VFSPETVTSRIDRELRRSPRKTNDARLAVHPAVAAYLQQENEQVKRMLEQEHHCKLVITADEELDQDEYKFL
jgi:Ribonuclease G/E